MPRLKLLDWLFDIKFWQPRKQPKYTPDGASIAKCGRCHELLKVGAGVRLIRHLNEEHGLPHDQSIDTVAWIYVRISRKKAGK
jgi:uncharacterized C2H2 Zn-finger protein